MSVGNMEAAGETGGGGLSMSGSQATALSMGTSFGCLFLSI